MHAGNVIKGQHTLHVVQLKRTEGLRMFLEIKKNSSHYLVFKI